jgi:hypothetical protein
MIDIAYDRRKWYLKDSGHTFEPTSRTKGIQRIKE